MWEYCAHSCKKVLMAGIASNRVLELTRPIGVQTFRPGKMEEQPIEDVAGL